jgi:hypothetical protein
MSSFLKSHSCLTIFYAEGDIVPKERQLAWKLFKTYQVKSFITFLPLKLNILACGAAKAAPDPLNMLAQESNSNWFRRFLTGRWRCFSETRYDKAFMLKWNKNNWKRQWHSHCNFIYIKLYANTLILEHIRTRYRIYGGIKSMISVSWDQNKKIVSLYFIIIIIISLLMTGFPYGLQIRRTGHNLPRGPSVGWWVLTTANAAGTNGLTCLSKHGGAQDNNKFNH